MEKYMWIEEFAINGWKNFICPHCKKVVWNDDIQVYLDWKFCPYCGKPTIIKLEDTED